jgi:hypothetical protein
MKARIIERTYPDGDKIYIIQVRHWMFLWMWVEPNDYFANTNCETLEEAKKNICWYNGTKVKDRVVSTPNIPQTGYQGPTAIWWMTDQLITRGFFTKKKSFTNLDHLETEATEMFREQIMKAYEVGYHTGLAQINGAFMPEVYYDQTYK